MNCKIEEVIWDGKKKYYCKTHRAPAFDNKNHKLEECLSKNKETFNNIINMNK